jgi:hypothetical protein
VIRIHDPLLIEPAKKTHKGKKFWEELITYFPFTKISVFDTSRKLLVCMDYEVNKTLQFERQ